MPKRNVIVRILCGMALIFGPTLLSRQSFAQDAPSRVTVLIEHEGEDDAGADLTFLIKSEFRNSPEFAVSDPDQPWGFHVRVRTIEIPNAQLTAYALIVTTRDLAALVTNPKSTLETYEATTIGYCGRSVQQQCAETAYKRVGAYIDESAAAYRAAFRSLLKK